MIKFLFSNCLPSYLRLCFFTVPAALIIFVCAVQAELIDRVVAEVNEDVITLSELNEEGESFIRRIITEVPAQDRELALANAYRDILDGLIDKLLISQEAARQGIVVSDEETEAAVNNIINNSNLSREAFFAELENRGIDRATYLDNIKSQIYQNKIITRDIRSKIIITEEMILDYYDNTYTRRVEEGGYYLLLIGIGWDRDTNDGDPIAVQQNKMEARR
ncbi:MAG: SurA N-terminal domain-containing protein, partial [Desulfocapsaceae bacterium]|nr:SurA N-terminal domain-containing protein [Desulfocapsaceae bacterium]